MKNSVISKEILKLLSQSESVYILLDGLDKAGIDVINIEEKLRIKFNINCENYPESFILGLLGWSNFPKVKKSKSHDLVK